MRLSFKHYRRYASRLAREYEKPEVKAYTGLTLSFFAVAFFGIFAIRPAVNTILGLVKEIETKQAVAQSFQEKINHLAQAQENYLASESFSPLLDEALPPNSVFAQFVRQVEGLAVKNGVRLTLLQVGQVVIVGQETGRDAKKAGEGLEGQEEGLSAIDFAVSLEGNYDNLRSFLGSLENWRRVNTPEVVSISVNRRQEEEFLSLNISGKIYYYRGGGQ